MYWMWKLQIKAINRSMSITTDTINSQLGNRPRWDAIRRPNVKAK